MSNLTRRQFLRGGSAALVTGTAAVTTPGMVWFEELMRKFTKRRSYFDLGRRPSLPPLYLAHGDSAMLSHDEGWFVMVGPRGQIMMSKDGVTWEEGDDKVRVTVQGTRYIPRIERFTGIQTGPTDKITEINSYEEYKQWAARSA